MDFNLPDINEYDYSLEENNIAFFPTKNRGESKLLLAHSEPFSITQFDQLIKHIPKNSVLIFNETKVIPARILFAKTTGAIIEILLINPKDNKDFPSALNEKGQSEWDVIIGNASKWKSGPLIINFQLNEQESGKLIANRTAENSVKFEWLPEKLRFYDIIEKLAKMPLPPYIKREAESEDKNRYQTVFSRNEGSVAAPTAGLHFTQEHLEYLEKNGIKQIALTLHVGIGTFRPVKGDIAKHDMHSEAFVISKNQLENLAENADKPWVVVGTTTLRALESLYVFAEKNKENKNPIEDKIIVEQWDKLLSNSTMCRKEAFSEILKKSEGKNLICGNTSLFILRGKPIKCADFLITNFHQPKSTLLMLVEAFASVNWQSAYKFALENNMRFLSYGDACLFKNKY